MARIHVISAGAAQSVVQQLAAAYEAATPHAVAGSFGAVGAQKARVLAGEPCDVIVLTAAVIDELLASGVAVGHRAELGRVGCGIAVRSGAPLPDVSNSRVLVGNLQAAEEIFLPDPAHATAGIHFLRTLDAFGIRKKLEPRLRPYPNGFQAMTALAGTDGPLRIGMTMITEIRLVRGVELVGPLPAAMQLVTTYALAVSARATEPDLARDFIRRLTSNGAQAMLRDAGFEPKEP
jgi:molybdate transport system substrate-binding protein